MREVLLALIFFAAFFEQTVLPPDALQGAMADGQIELEDEVLPRSRGNVRGGRVSAKLVRLRKTQERWPSGLRRTLGKRV